MAHFGSLMRDERARRGWSIQQVAEFCDVSPSTVRNWESGRHLPWSGHFGIVAEFLRLDEAQVAGLVRGARLAPEPPGLSGVRLLAASTAVNGRLSRYLDPSGELHAPGELVQLCAQLMIFVCRNTPLTGLQAGAAEAAAVQLSGEYELSKDLIHLLRDLLLSADEVSARLSRS